VRILKHSNSVSSRLIGYQLRVRLYADIVELDYKGERVAVMERLVGAMPTESTTGIFSIRWCVSPGAFRRYVFREALFPTIEFSAALTMRCSSKDPTRPIWITCASCTSPPAMAPRANVERDTCLGLYN
jgi:hypothetical protein